MKLKLTQEELVFAKDWIKECQWSECYEDFEIDDLDQSVIEKGLEKHYSGGIAQFKKDSK
jgi:hypothetical protein